MDAIIKPEASLVKELDELRPNGPVGLLSRNQRFLLIERTFIGLYRWYTQRSQQTRDWNPDLSFDWRSYRKDHSDEVHTIVEGFYAVEQYVPDYVTALLKVIRTSYGRSHFHLRWGSEEEKHADMWRNAVLFGGKRSLEWVEEYGATLRGQEWKLPWEDPLHMLFYTVFQERATQLNYVNLGLAAKGKSDKPGLQNAEDPVLAKMCQVIAVDEAAHYNFFLEAARLFLYYFPEDSTQAMVDVIRHFGMPAGDIIPNYREFAETVARNGVYGPREQARDVVRVGLEQLGAESVRALEEGIRKSREIPDENGVFRSAAIFETLDHDFIERKVRQLFDKIGTYERQVGLDEIYGTQFVENPDWDIRSKSE